MDARRAVGVCCARKRVARLLRAAGLVGCHRRRRTRTTVADLARSPAPDLVARDFTAAAPNRLWFGDITYIATAEGWLYLAMLLDAHSRRIVGWAMAEHLLAELAERALAMALLRHRPPPGLVHHSDRGGQYTAAAYQVRLADRGIVCSMRRAGACLDNIVVERFFATHKAELVNTRAWPTRAAARQAIFAWRAVRYNRQRRHAALAYRIPVTHEEGQMLLLQDLAA